MLPRPMKLDAFQYELPERLIAQHPLPGRSDSRLLQLRLDDGSLHDRMIKDLPGLLRAGDLLVFNDTRVIPARLFARKESGGKAAIFPLGPDARLDTGQWDEYYRTLDVWRQAAT